MDKNDILDYVTETPGNTNRAVLGSMLDSIGGGGSSEIEIWMDSSEGAGEYVLYGTIAHLKELYLNGSDYQIFANEEEYPYFFDVKEPDHVVAWAKSENIETATKYVLISGRNDMYTAAAVWTDTSTAPTSVEVGVKHK